MRGLVNFRTASTSNDPSKRNTLLTRSVRSPHCPYNRAGDNDQAFQTDLDHAIPIV